MNWNTKHLVKLTQAALDESDGCCPHVKVGDTVYRASENDPWGIVTAFYHCAECEEAAQAREEEELYQCTDCGKEFPLKEGVLFRWWDHDPSQGDEPLPVCGPCRKLPKHIERVRKNNADLERELGDDY